MSELLPCPFCGTKAVSPVLDHNQGMKWGAVECDGCCAKGPEVRTDYTENGPWVEKAKEEWNSRHVPEGMALVPQTVSAESGHKAGMIGDFSETVSIMCEACDGSGEDENADDMTCAECDGSGEYGLKVPVSWTTIKAIHRRIVEISAAPKPGGGE